MTIYLDYQATTPLAPEAFDTMVPLLRDQFANPHSAHRLGRAAAATRTSRLSCQIILEEKLDGLTVHIPGESHNMQGM